MDKSPQKSPRPRGRTPKGESSPPRRESPRKRQSLQTKESASASKLKYDSSDSESDGSHDNKGAVDRKPFYTDEFIASLTDMIEYYAERMLIAGREERVELGHAFDVSFS